MLKKRGASALPPPTEVPGTPTFTLTALPVSIDLEITPPVLGGRAMGYRYRVRRRNAADTGWESVQPWVDLGARRSARITQYSITQLIEAGRQYQVKVVAYNIIGNGVESGYQGVTPLTNLPAVPTFTLEALDAKIRLNLTKVTDPLNDPAYPLYNYFIEERNAADTAWVADADGAQIITSDPFSAAGSHTIISDTETSLIIDVRQVRLSGQSSHSLINDRAYRIRVRSFNDIDYSAWSAFRTATPMAGLVPAVPPGLPTFTLSALRYEVDGGQVRTTVNFTPAPNADGVGVTHWVFRYRESGTATWATHAIVAQADLNTEYGFKLDETELGKTYELQVASRNTSGDSAFTASQSIVITRPLPAVPTFTINYNPFTFNDALQFSVSPALPTRPPLPLTGYGWRFRESGTTTWTTASSNISPFYASSVESDDLGKVIEVQMRAINAAGNSAYSASQTLQIIDVPNPPTITLTAQPDGFDVDAVLPATGYRATAGHFRYREGTSGDWMDAGSSPNIRLLKPATLYQVQAWTSNPAGESTRITRSVTTLASTQAPGVPTFTATPGDARIILSDVTPTAGGTPTSYAYQLSRRNAADSRWAAWQNRVVFTTSPQTITAYNASNFIENGRRHRIRLEAINTIGDSAWSDAVEVTPTN